MEIRCMVSREGNLYIAMSLDFGLAAQASSRDGAIAKLNQQIQEYIEEAINQDRAFQDKLLKRKGPLSWFVMYYWLHFKAMFRHNGDSPFFSKFTSDFVSHA